MKHSLPLRETVEPSNPAELAAAIRDAAGSGAAVYPIGGGTSLDFGLPAKKPGVGLSLAKLNRVIDFPARDMTITVEAGITMQRLAETLATERQQLPVDVPLAARATLGGVIATNFNGPRRYGYGPLRDFVIGITAVDGRGTPFKGGGRVVKNVAGYDFCKLLTGSLGTLGVITQVTLKLRPIAERSAWLVCGLHDWNDAENRLTALVTSQTTPVAVELLAGAEWARDPALQGLSKKSLWLAVGLEGTAAEVDWMRGQLDREWWSQGGREVRTLTGPDATELHGRLTEWPAAGSSPLVLKASLVPSAVTSFMQAVTAVDPAATFQAHAGNGIVIAKLSEFPAGGLAGTLVGKLQAAAAAAQGSLVVLSNPSGGEMTHQSVWGSGSPFGLMTTVKRQFDPHDVLNPGRFVYV